MKAAVGISPKCACSESLRVPYMRQVWIISFRPQRTYQETTFLKIVKVHDPIHTSATPCNANILTTIAQYARCNTLHKGKAPNGMVPPTAAPSGILPPNGSKPAYTYIAITLRVTQEPKPSR